MTPILPAKNTKETGDWAEKLALRYLRRRGLYCRHRHYDCRLDTETDCAGELDLVMQWGRTLIFVEVRYRRMGKALKSVDAKKQALLRCCAQQYRIKQDVLHLPFRFDVVYLEGEGDNSTIKWRKNAFPAKLQFET